MDGHESLQSMHVMIDLPAWRIEKCIGKYQEKFTQNIHSNHLLQRRTVQQLNSVWPRSSYCRIIKHCSANFFSFKAAWSSDCLGFLASFNLSLEISPVSQTSAINLVGIMLLEQIKWWRKQNKTKLPEFKWAAYTRFISPKNGAET